jgi:hypothetical protein
MRYAMRQMNIGRQNLDLAVVLVYRDDPMQWVLVLLHLADVPGGRKNFVAMRAEKGAG